jgi:hypothetical protein
MMRVSSSHRVRLLVEDAGLEVQVQVGAEAAGVLDAHRRDAASGNAREGAGQHGGGGVRGGGIDAQPGASQPDFSTVRWIYSRSRIYLRRSTQVRD